MYKHFSISGIIVSVLSTGNFNTDKKNAIAAYKAMYE